MQEKEILEKFRETRSCRYIYSLLLRPIKESTKRTILSIEVNLSKRKEIVNLIFQRSKSENTIALLLHTTTV